MMMLKILFLIALLTLAACGKHDATNSSYTRPPVLKAGDASSIFSDIKNGKLEDFKSKFATVPDVNAVYDDGTTLLTAAAQENKPEIFKFLLDSGADPSLANKGGENSLDIAKAKNHVAIWLMLDPAHQIDEQPLLLEAVVKKKPQVLKDKLDAGVSPNFVDATTGETPLTQAVLMANLGALNMLTKWKSRYSDEAIDLEMPNAKGQTPHHVALEKNDPKVLNIFKKLGYP